MMIVVAFLRWFDSWDEVFRWIEFMITIHPMRVRFFLCFTISELSSLLSIKSNWIKWAIRYVSFSRESFILPVHSALNWKQSSRLSPQNTRSLSQKPMLSDTSFPCALDYVSTNLLNMSRQVLNVCRILRSWDGLSSDREELKWSSDTIWKGTKYLNTWA